MTRSLPSGAVTGTFSWLTVRAGEQSSIAPFLVQVSVAGLREQVPVTAFRGDASWIGYPMVSGRWYADPGQADVPLGFLTATGKRVGDTVTVTLDGRPVRVRIVGDVFDPDNSGLTMLTGFGTLAGADPGLAPTSTRSACARGSRRSATPMTSGPGCPAASQPASATPPGRRSRT